MTETIRQESSWDRTIAKAVSVPAARATDVETSHIAASLHTESGKRGSNVAAVIDLVRIHQGRTSAELARLCDLTRHEVARRLPEAEKAGAVFKGPKRRCDANGSLAVTWWLTK
ncbi:MAG: winged helix-turn-helix domain-containing protein [Luteibacter sp.]|uniref:winged helix-turn-helix domain-containing protein n=1 Tax=Luteibacter sp. TaxID=1886636 RepID=UPI0028097376|nr:winged helix-turn-helix domain-containing protein [Luteibacter sp.]MDQ7996090.1 winged helix-turn-helix domain-containing protein [Luteibacter sp.]